MAAVEEAQADTCLRISMCQGRTQYLSGRVLLRRLIPPQVSSIVGVIACSARSLRMVAGMEAQDLGLRTLHLLAGGPVVERAQATRPKTLEEQGQTVRGTRAETPPVLAAGIHLAAAAAQAVQGRARRLHLPMEATEAQERPTPSQVSQKGMLAVVVAVSLTVRAQNLPAKVALVVGAARGPAMTAKLRLLRPLPVNLTQAAAAVAVESWETMYISSPADRALSPFDS